MAFVGQRQHPCRVTTPLGCQQRGVEQAFQGVLSVFCSPCHGRSRAPEGFQHPLGHKSEVAGGQEVGAQKPPQPVGIGLERRVGHKIDGLVRVGVEVVKFLGFPGAPKTRLHRGEHSLVKKPFPHLGGGSLELIGKVLAVGALKVEIADEDKPAIERRPHQVEPFIHPRPVSEKDGWRGACL